MSLFFLSGLPRTGSHLLSSILSQNTDISSSGISSLYGICNNSRVYLNSYTGDGELSFSSKNNDLFKEKIIRGMANSYYDFSKKNIIDKHRLWTTKSGIETIKKITDNPKIIIMQRDILEVVQSLVFNYQKEGLSLLESEKISLNLDSIPANPLLSPMAGFVNAKINNSEKMFLFVDYNEMINDIDKTIKRVYNFLDVEHFSHNLKKIKEVNSEVGNNIPKSFLGVRQKIKKQKINQNLSDKAMGKISYLNMIYRMCNNQVIDEREKKILENFYENNFSWENL